MQEILTLFVAFGEAMRSKGSTKFGGVQIVECADVGVDVGAHDDFRFRGGLSKKSVEGVKEAEVRCGNTCPRAWMVSRGKGEGKLFVTLFPSHLFSTTIFACQLDIHADKYSREFAGYVGCDRWSCSCGFPSLLVFW